MTQGFVGGRIEPGSFVELRGRPWLVEEVRGEPNDRQALNLSPEASFCEISSFARFDRGGITMKLPLMPVYSPFPGDYRTRGRTLADFAESKRLEALAWQSRGRP